MRCSLVLAAAAVLLAGCGSDNPAPSAATPSTPQPTATAAMVTVTAPSPATPAPSAAPATTAAPAPASTAPETNPTSALSTPDGQFCADSRGKKLQKANKDAINAFNESDPKGFSQAVDAALDASALSPVGAVCTSDALNGLATLASGSPANLKGIDTNAVIAKIRAFEDKHQIDHP